MGDRQGIMLASPYTQGKLERWFKQLTQKGVPAFAFGQRKLNGERAVWTGDTLISSEGNEITGVPHIVDSLKKNFRGRCLDGEAYCHGLSLQQIHSIVSRGSGRLHQNYLAIELHAFDMPLSALEVAQYKRLAYMYEERERFERADFVRLEETVRLSSHAQAFAAVNQYLEEGYEGLIVRHPLGVYAPMSRAVMMKWKPKEEDEYEIVQVIEGQGKCEGMVGSFVVKDKEGRTFHVGSLKVDMYERKALWEIRNSLIGKMCKVRYVALSDNGKPPSSTFISLVEGL